MCLAQGHNAVTGMKLQPAAFRSWVKHSTAEPLRSLIMGNWEKTVLSPLMENDMENIALLVC